MGRPATASAILELKGAYKTNPERRRLKEPDPAGVFDMNPPEGLEKDEIEAWKEVISQVPKLVLTGSDRNLVELTAVLWAQFRREKHEMAVARMNRMVTNFGFLGMTPSDRTRLQVDKPKNNEFDDL